MTSARTNEDLAQLNDAMTPIDHESSPFVSKQISVTLDTNPNGNYSSGQVIFQTDNLSSNGLYASIKDAIIELPMVFVLERLTGAVDLRAGGLDYILSTKCSDLAFINTMSVELDGGSVVSVVDNISSYLIFKKHDVMGPIMKDELCNYQRDGCDWTLVDGALCNNSSRMDSETITQFSSVGANPGMYHRTKNSFVRPDDTSMAALFDTTYIQNANMNHIVSAATHKLYYYTAHLPLRDLPFFASMPLSRGLNLKITLNINQCAFTFAHAANEITFDPDVNFVISGSGRVNPLMISSKVDSIYQPADSEGKATIGAGNGSYYLEDGTFRVSASIVSNRFSGHVQPACQTAQHPLLRSCRLLCPVYQLLPSYESSYLSSVGQREVNYLRVISGVIESIGPNSRFENLLNSGVVNATKLILVIQHSSTSNGATGKVHSPNISPLSSSPATTSPFLLDSFNVKVSGQPIFREYYNYDYDAYVESIGREGGFLAPFTRREWTSGMYKFMVIPLTRRTPDTMNISQSISISGYNRTKKVLDIFWYIEQESSVTVDVYSGKVIKA
jgi:hypothetical protein